METQVGWALVIDADTSAHALYRQALGDLGYEIDICDHGASASLAIMRRGYDLIVLNPCTSGICAIEILRHCYRQPAPVPLIFVGPTPAEPNASTGSVALQGLLQKPFTAGQLREAVESSLREQRDHARLGVQLKLGGEGDLGLLYEHLARLLVASFEADRASLMLWSGADHIDVAASAGFPFTVPGSTNAPLKDSVSGWVIRHAEPLLLEPDAELPFDLQSAWRNDAIRSGICAPLLVRGQVLGVLAIARRVVRPPFTGADLDRLIEQAASIASLIEHTRLNSSALRRTERMSRLSGLAGALMASSDLEQVLAHSIEQVAAAYPGIHGYLFLREAQSPWIDRLIPIGDVPPSSPSVDDLRDQPGLAGQVLADGIARLRKTIDIAHELAAWEQGSSAANPQLLCVPLKTETAVYGAIELLGWQQAFDEEDIQFMNTLAGLAALAIERSQQYTAVARQADRYAAMFTHASDAILLVEREHKTIVAANPAAAELSGYSELDLAAIAPARLIAPALMGGRSAVPVADLLAGTVPEYDGYIRTRSGYSVPVSIAVTQLTIDSTGHLLLVVRNMSEAHRHAQQLAQAEKLAGMTRLTASIAHQINNPLQALHNTLHLLISRSFTEEKRERLLGMAQMEVDRLTVLVRRMLELHRPTNDDMRLVSIHSLLEGVIAGAAPQLQQHHVSIERDWAERLPWVNGIGGHLKQVFQDLVTNAAEAMPNGGRLVVCTRLEEGTNGQVPARVLVEFVDNGPGIPEDETQLIFEPFYTTKGTNTGLGLAISHSIIERHGGTLTVSSGTAGTTFRVMLPAVSGTKV